MQFREAIESGFHQYRYTNGRASRSALWWWLLYANFAVAGPVLTWFLYANMAPAIPLLVDFQPPVEPGNGTAWATRVILLALLIPTGTLVVRRLHDTNRSGRWLLVGIVPVLGTLVLMAIAAMPGTSGPNQYGEAPESSASGSPRRIEESAFDSGKVRPEPAL